MGAEAEPVLYSLGDTSTIYMDGSEVFNVRRAERPGIVATLRMWREDADKLRELFDRQLETATRPEGEA